MPANASFTYAIFKRLQAAYVSAYGSGVGGHLECDLRRDWRPPA